ncbi:MAG: hypothetical protein EPO29_08170 [Betaproteobacteria bacterium]|nr:MAG: hypothetical protein EPO29_08170 [Betaproteobacteria bacterium]
MRVSRRLALAAITLLGTPAAAWSAPYTPGDDQLVLERLPSRPGDPVQRELKALRQAHAGNPGDAALALRLARRYYDLATSDGDPRYIGYAEAVLRSWQDPGTAPAEILIVRAQLVQYRHEFARALQLLDRALQIAPGDPEALAWRAAVRMVRAEYSLARADCSELATVASELLASGCAAFVDAATGRTRQAYERLRAALARHPDARATLKLWVQTLLADMACRLGDPAAAESHYRAALALELTDQYLIAAFAEFLLERDRPGEAAALLRPWERSDVLLLLLARAERALGAAAADRHAKTLEARFADAARRGERLHVQDEARFRLEFRGDAQGALALAQENWSLQKEPRDAQMLLEAALAARAPAAARPALDWLAASGFEDPRLAALATALARLPR